MGDKEEACERFLESIEEAINSLERGKEECSMNNWELFDPEELEAIIDQLREMAQELSMKVSDTEDSELEE